jgi:hypothetical protein
MTEKRRTPDHVFESRYGVRVSEAMEEQQAEYASFTVLERLHILRALHIAEADRAALPQFSIPIAAARHPDVQRMWANFETLRVGDLMTVYRPEGADWIRSAIPHDGEASACATLLEKLIFVTIKELNVGILERFGPYRFLYERIIGPEIHPYLPPAFLAAVSLPRWPLDWRVLAAQSVEQWDDCSPPLPPVFFPTSL